MHLIFYIIYFNYPVFKGTEHDATFTLTLLNVCYDEANFNSYNTGEIINYWIQFIYFQTKIIIIFTRSVY
jgi:hypothetical protein